MQISHKELLAAAEKVLAESPEVVLAIVFGSIARGEGNATSDIDLAVLLKTPDNSKLLELQLSLVRALKTEKIDLIDLHTASIPLAYRIAKDGKVLLCRDEKQLQHFLATAISRYLDIKPLRERMFAQSLRTHSDGS